MGKILLLDEITSSKIAAGEVVERPASVIKEMIDNSIDAGATRVNIEIKNGGIKYIKIEDNGTGFEPDDVVIAFDKHATSKIVCADDIENVKTLGFRGEALASIASVSIVTLKTKTKDAENGVFVQFKGGELIDSGSCGCKTGSSFVVENLFFNTPARYKFLKKDQTEAAYVCDAVEKAALSHPNVSFTLVSDKKQVLYTPGNSDMLSAIYGIFGKDFTQFLKKVSYNQGNIEIKGFVGARNLTYGNRNRELTFINGRFIKNKTIVSAIDEAYKTLVMRGKYPCVILDIKINPSQVDVNVTPSKTDVRFSDEASVFKAIYNAIYGTLFEVTYQPLPETQSDISPVKIPDTFKSPVSQPQIRKEAPIIKTQEEPEKIVEPIPRFEYKMPETISDDHISQEVHEAVAVSLFDKPAELTSSEPDLPDTAKSNQYEDVYRDGIIIGQLFDTYILLEYKNDFYMIDQHASHERLMYERIKKALSSGDNDSQILLSPVTVKLSPSETDKFRASKDALEKLGFDIDEFGINTLIIRSVPMLLGEIDAENFVVGALSYVQIGAKNSVNVFPDNAVYTMACKAAIKANHRLSEIEMRALLNELAGIPDLDTCPHGRPIIVKMSKYEIERKFHRA